MAQKSHGARHGTRHKHSADSDTTETVNDHLQEFEEGQQVQIYFHPSVQEGRVHTRFHGQKAQIVGKRGDAYKLHLQDGDKEKELFLKAIHWRA